MLARLQDDFANVKAILHGSEGSLDVGIIKDGYRVYDLERTQAEKIEDLGQQCSSFGRGGATNFLGEFSLTKLSEFEKTIPAR